MPFNYREPGKIVQDVLQSEMDLSDSQVIFTNQKWNIPTIGILIVVSYIGPSKIIANLNEWQDDGANGLQEVQSLTMAHMIQIDILGYGNDVRMRKEEIPMALRSVYSQQLQESNSMQIARQPGALMDTSFIQDTKMITRYTTTIITTSVNQKIKALDYMGPAETKVYSNDPVLQPIADFKPDESPFVVTP